MQEIVNILKSCLGPSKGHDRSRGQIKFNCPNCDMNRGKGNLEINYVKDVYSCWACRDQDDGVKGYDIRWLVKKYGGLDLFYEYQRVRPRHFVLQEREVTSVELPEGTYRLSLENSDKRWYKWAKQYLKRRKIDEHLIERYDIHFCNEGDHKGRIIFPSYNIDGHLDYFVGRDFTGKSKIKYMNHPNPKNEIIFNESIINWDASVFLVEGVFDQISLYNGVAMLGKKPSDLLVHRIREQLQGNLYIALDGDAQQEAWQIANDFNFGRLKDRIFIVKFEGDEDASSIRLQFSEADFYKSIVERVVRI